MARLPVTKTPKVYVGGAFIRSESGRTFALKDSRGEFIGHIPQCTRKDLRNAVESAAKAIPGWARRTAYNRGQIIYRLAEMIEARSAELALSLVRSGESPGTAKREVEATVDRLVYYAGWADKYEQVLGNVNAVSGPFFNFTVTEPMGVLGMIAPTEKPLLALISLVIPAIVSGNTVIVLTSETQPYPAVLLGEMLASSDLPGGVINVLTGFHKELIPTFATHQHLRGIGGVVTPEEQKTLQLGAAESIKRLHLQGQEDAVDWFAHSAQGILAIRNWVEFKTTWHPIGA